MVGLPDELMKSVVFLCVDKVDKKDDIAGKKRRVAAATGFFVKVSLKRDVFIEYLVTARHCIDEARKHQTLYVRCNLRSSATYIDAETNVDDWYHHPMSDVAAIPISSIKFPNQLGLSDLDHFGLPMGLFVGGAPSYDCPLAFGVEVMKESSPIIQRVTPSVGFEVCFVGLFTQHHGEDRNLPIARFGHISMMPSQLHIELPGNIDFKGVAYLIDCQVWGGNSGSPVFALLPHLDKTFKTDVFPNFAKESKSHVKFLHWVTEVALNWDYKFLGVLNGHYPNIQRTTAISKGYKEEVPIETDLNSGIAIVTPADVVRQLLMENDELKE
ncbi:MAG: hypothetical protein ACYDHZ_06995 [Dehalococcoidia bacterium]